MDGPLVDRLRFSWLRICKPVLDGAACRSFSSTTEYREWCEKHLPAYPDMAERQTKVLIALRKENFLVWLLVNVG